MVLLALVLASPPADAFEATVRPVLVEACVKCHGPDKQKGGLRVDSRAALLAGGDSGPALVPGDPDNSLLVKAIRHQELEMPPGGKLPDTRIAAVAKWVKDGAVWPGAAAGEPTQAARKPGRVSDEDRNWWAFRPVAAPPVPAGAAATDIDRFLVAAGTLPGPEAGRLALLRRLTFDLTGLPPTSADLDRPESYEQTVDRLLASPAYAERQARLWLDLVRYADSDGYRADFPRPHAAKYRDYVIRSFAADKPYDRFLTEQLAGDEAFPGDPDALLATGYLRQWSYEYNQRDVRGQWAAILNDVTDVTADVFLGIGFGCARCHDHKFDPVLQKDYFALQAFFAGLSFRDEPVFPSAAAKAEYQTKLARWEADTAAVRAEIDALLEPIRKKEMARAVFIFPDDIRAIFAKPPADRTTAERQLHELANRQVDYEHERAPDKLSKDGKEKYAALKKKLTETPKPADPTAMVARDHGPDAAPTLVPAGRSKGPVEPAFPTVLAVAAPTITPGQASTGRRRALAAWLSDPAHPLTARVLVNRLWQQHFGVGLVGTASDFGTLGDKPTHPALLDHLAATFVADGWSLKAVHRRIVLSAAYRQTAGVGVCRPPVRRLDAEQVRDAMLAVSGDLGTTPAFKRSVQTPVRRNAPDPLLAAFDTADGLTSCSRRNVTVTPTQSLLLLNGPFGLARAATFANRVRADDPAVGVGAAFRLAYGRPPTDAEAAEAVSFLRQQGGGADAWADLCHALLNSNEFLYLD